MQNRAWVTENSHKHDTDQISNVLATTLGSEPLTKLQQLIDDLYSHHKPWLRGSNAFNADNRCPPSSRSHMQQSKRPRFVDTHGSAPGLLVRLRINSYQHRLLRLDSQKLKVAAKPLAGTKKDSSKIYHKTVVATLAGSHQLKADTQLVTANHTTHQPSRGTLWRTTRVHTLNSFMLGWILQGEKPNTVSVWHCSLLFCFCSRALSPSRALQGVPCVK